MSKNPRVRRRTRLSRIDPIEETNLLDYKIDFFWIYELLSGIKRNWLLVGYVLPKVSVDFSFTRSWVTWVEKVSVAFPARPEGVWPS